MVCPICKDNMVEEETNVCACETFPGLMVRNVPTLVCKSCGEKAFRQSTLKVFEQIKANKFTADGAEWVPWFDYRKALNRAWPVESFTLSTTYGSGTLSGMGQLVSVGGTSSG